MCFFSIITRFLIIVFGILRPARCTQMALGGMELTSWAKYWVVYAFLVSLELVGDTFFAWMPVYAETKLLVVLWLVASAPQSSVWVFDTILNPLLNRHMPKVEHVLKHDKRHLLSFTSNFCKQSLNAVLPVVSKFWNKPGHVPHLKDSIEDLNKNEDTNLMRNRMQPVEETLTNSLSSHFYDTNADEESYDENFSSSNSQSQSPTQVTQRKKNLSKHSLPELAKKMATHLSPPSAIRAKLKQYTYDMQLNDATLKNNPQLDIDEAVERSHRQYSSGNDQKRYQ